MAGIGVRLNNLFQKNTLTTDLLGFFYSTVVTVAPMFVVIINLVLMEYFLDFSSLGYAERELFSCTVLYTFIFSLLTSAPFNAVLSRYVSDVIYQERYQDILPCYYLGMIFYVTLSCIFGIPFCLWEHFVGGVSVWYVFAGFWAYISLVFVFYAMIYLSICKDYQRIAQYYGAGMLLAFFTSLFFRFKLHWGIPQSMLAALDVGFFLTAVLENALIKRYFRENSNRYKLILGYFREYWKLVITNFFYILGMYVHNFVFWTNKEMNMIVVKSFVCNQPYDMASCLAMFTNISATIIFIARVEMYFHEKYKLYSDAVTGGRDADIQNTKRRMFRQLSNELMTLARIQFIISVVIYLVCMVILPSVGISSITMKIYPSLAVGYFILFLMYSAIIFLYYFNDLAGAVWTSTIFLLVTLVGSILSMRLPVIWYGTGVIVGSFAGWTVAYLRLRWIEKHMDVHVFCVGDLIPRGKGKRPSGKVFDRRLGISEIQRKENT